jgi:hypothetical protein
MEGAEWKSNLDLDGGLPGDETAHCATQQLIIVPAIVREVIAKTLSAIGAKLENQVGERGDTL